MPAATELLDGLDSYLWFCPLNMASGFWVVKMTERARAISAFVTPFGLFEWTRMPFGLKNAPQIYQRMLDNAIYGILRIPKAGEGDQATERADQDVITSGEAEPADQIAIGRRSYIDDILIDDATFDGMCEKLERVMQACK